MGELIEILSSLHPDVDFENCKNLVDGKILEALYALIQKLEDEA